MQVSDLERFRGLLVDRGTQLTEWLNSATVAEHHEVEKVQALIGQIRTALEKVEDDSYGRCTVCEEEVEVQLLECQPEATVCLDCLDENDRRLLEDDLNMAGKMQQALLPAKIPEIEGFVSAVKLVQASAVGGDYYDFLPCVSPDRVSRVIIADAMGHGVSAGLLMSNLQGALRVLSLEIHSPCKLVSRLNQWLCHNVAITKFVSLVTLCLEQTSDEQTTLSYTNAGHPSPIIVRHDGTVEMLEVTGGVLGVHEGFEYDEAGTTLKSGDLVVLYTDGVTETANENGDQFGEDSLVTFLQKYQSESPGTIVDGLISEIDKFRGSSARSDDLTLIALRKT